VKRLLTYLLLLGFLGTALQAMAQEEDGGKQLRVKRRNPRVKTRLGFSPVLGIYSANKHHTSGARQKMAFNLSLKEEFRLDKHNRCFFMAGAEYMMHGLSFNSYYFYPDSLKLYTGKMNYKYSLLIHEVDFPLQFKLSFQKETNRIWTRYIYGGYCYRWLVASHLKVTRSGEDIDSRSVKLKFKLPAFNPVNSSFFNIGFGIQKNAPLRHNAVFAELQFRYALSPFYFSEDFAPSSLYMNGHHVLLTVGVKF